MTFPTAAMPRATPAAARRAAVVATEVTKRFGARVALDQVSLNVAEGEAVVLWGANGAGKTTLLRCILGLLSFQGAVRVFGCDVRRQGKQARQFIGCVAQEPGVQGEQTVLEAATFYGALRGLTPQQARAALAPWHLADVAAQPVRNLSGGMKQKLALAIALLGDPPLLLLDEPASHLDVRTRAELSGLLETLKASGKTLILCSHRPSDVWKLADRVVVLAQGRLAASGRPDQVRGWLSERIALGITVPRERKAEAAALLTAHGLLVHPNGTQVWVDLHGAEKITPLHLLAEARIPVLDFELEPAAAGREAGEA